MSGLSPQRDLRAERRSLCRMRYQPPADPCLRYSGERSQGTRSRQTQALAPVKFRALQAFGIECGEMVNLRLGLLHWHATRAQVFGNRLWITEDMALFEPLATASTTVQMPPESAGFAGSVVDPQKTVLIGQGHRYGVSRSEASSCAPSPCDCSRRSGRH